METNENDNDIMNNQQYSKERTTTDSLVLFTDPSSVLQEIAKRDISNRGAFFNFIFNKYEKDLEYFNKYTWEKEGKQIVTSNLFSLTLKEKQILKCLNIPQIPKNLRRNYWLTITGAYREMTNNPNYYASLSTNYPDYIPDPNTNQIDLDIHRTFPEEEFYKNEENLAKIKRICNAYGRRCYAVGYCQGFNHMVGRILEVVGNEEEAFWIFTQLVEQCLPCDFFCELAEMLTYFKLVTWVLEDNFSHVFEHLRSVMVDLYFNNTIYKWLLSLFIQCVHPDIQIIIWDMLLLEGTVVLFKSIIALVSIFENEIMNISSLEEANQFFEITITRKPTPTEIETIKKYLIVKLFDFDEEELKVQKNKIFPNTVEEIKANGRYVHTRATIKEINCDLDWPLCSHDVTYRQDISDYFVYSTLNGINVKDNYIDELEQQQESKKKNEKEIKKEIKKENNDNLIKERSFINALIQRRKHCCNSEISTMRYFVDKSNKGEIVNYNEVDNRRKELYENYKEKISFKREDLLKDNK